MVTSQKQFITVVKNSNNCSKVFTYDSLGKIKKKNHNPITYSGEARKIPIYSIQDIVNQIYSSRKEPRDYFIMGSDPKAPNAYILGSKSAKSKYQRSGDSFVQSSIIVFDIDIPDDILVGVNVIDAIAQVMPEFAGAGYAFSPSASARAGLKSRAGHLYFFIKNPNDRKRVTKVFAKKSIELGFSYTTKSPKGKFISNPLIDVSVCYANGCIYENATFPLGFEPVNPNIIWQEGNIVDTEAFNPYPIDPVKFIPYARNRNDLTVEFYADTILDSKDYGLISALDLFKLGERLSKIQAIDRESQSYAGMFNGINNLPFPPGTIKDIAQPDVTFHWKDKSITDIAQYVFKNGVLIFKSGSGDACLRAYNSIDKDVIKKVKGLEHTGWFQHFYRWRLVHGSRINKFKACGRYLVSCDNLTPRKIYEALIYLLKSFRTQDLETNDKIFKLIPKDWHKLVRLIVEEFQGYRSRSNIITEGRSQIIDSVDNALDIILRDKSKNYLVKAPMGIGKTQKIMKPLNELFNGYTISVSPTISLARTLAVDHGADLYSDFKIESNGVATTIHSLHKITHPRIRLFLIDEIKEVLSAITHGPVEDKAKSLACLKTYMNNSNILFVGADANLSDSDLDIIDLLTDKKIVVLEVKKTFKNKIYCNLAYYACDYEFLSSISELKSDRKTFVTSDSLVTAKAIGLNTNALCIQKYSADNKKVIDFFENPNDIAEQLKGGLVASPVISSGTSLNEKSGFIRTMGVFSGVTIDVNSAIQQLMRVRGRSTTIIRTCNLPQKRKTIYVRLITDPAQLLEKGYAQEARLLSLEQKKTEEEANKEYERAAIYAKKFEEFNKVWAINQAVTNGMNLERRVTWWMALENEFEVEYYSENASIKHRALVSEFKKEAKSDITSNVFMAKDIDKSEYDRPKCPPDRKTRYQIKKVVATGDITEADVFYILMEGGFECVRNRSFLAMSDEELIKLDKEQPVVLRKPGYAKKVIFSWIIKYFQVDLKDGECQSLNRHKVKNFTRTLRKSFIFSRIINEVFKIKITTSQKIITAIFSQMGLHFVANMPKNMPSRFAKERKKEFEDWDKNGLELSGFCKRRVQKIHQNRKEKKKKEGSIEGIGETL